MPVHVLFVSFKFNIPPGEYAQVIKPLMGDILNAPGFRWKIWLINHVECTAGGIYLFDDASHAEMFIRSPLMVALKLHPFLSNFYVMPFDVLEPETALTHGPIGKGVRV